MEGMIGKDDILSFDFYKKGKPFFGSFNGMRYRIVKEKAEEEGGEDTYLAITYPDRVSFENTPEEEKISKTFPFSKDGRAEVLSWLDEQFEEVYKQ